MFDHATLCGTSSDPANNFVEMNLASEMHCICGFSSANGNCLSKHLLTCHHSSVYPNFETAQENIVKKNMLDMLGLVRRDGEVTPEPQNETIQTPMEEDFPPMIVESLEESDQPPEPSSVLQHELQTKLSYEPPQHILEEQSQHNIELPQQQVISSMSQENMHQIEQPSHIDHIPSQTPVRIFYKLHVFLKFNTFIYIDNYAELCSF